MTRRRPTELALARETLRMLSPDRLAIVRGGAIPPDTVQFPCGGGDDVRKAGGDPQ